MEDNMSKGWSEYGRLVLKELERLNEGQENLRKDLDSKFQELDKKMTEFKSTEKEVLELREWKDKVTEVWSVTQMKESKNEVYAQKNRWLKIVGGIIVIQVLFTLLMAFKDQIFG